MSCTTHAITPARVGAATLAALVGNLLIYGVARAAGASFSGQIPYPINAVAVAAASILPITVAALVLALIVRHRPTVQNPAAWLGLGVAVLSSISPFIVAGDTPTAIALTLMHLITGIAWLTATRHR